MIHNFDTDIAGQYGMLEAILLNHIYFWVEKNRANEMNFYDDTYWTYNSTRAFNNLFPYVSERQIKNALKHLREEGLLLTGNYNKSSYDRTLWYALTEKGLSIVQKCPMDNAENGNGSCDNVPPIPDIKPDKEPSNITGINSGSDLHSNPEQEEPISSAQSNANDSLVVITMLLNSGEEFPFTQGDVDVFASLYPAVDVMQEMRAMKGWCLSNPAKRKTKTGIRRFVNSWLSKEQNRGGNPQGRYMSSSQMTTVEYAESIRGWNT